MGLREPLQRFRDTPLLKTQLAFHGESHQRHRIHLKRPVNERFRFSETLQNCQVPPLERQRQRQKLGEGFTLKSGDEGGVFIDGALILIGVVVTRRHLEVIAVRVRVKFSRFQKLGQRFRVSPIVVMQLTSVKRFGGFGQAIGAFS